MKRKWTPEAVLNESEGYTGNRRNGIYQAAGTEKLPGANVEEVETDRIVSEENPRTKFDVISVSELAENIKVYGLLQPITVRKRGAGYFLIAGERRLRAYKLLKRKTIPAIIKSVDEIDPENIPVVKLIENIQREDLTDFDLAGALHILKQKTGKTNAGIAKDLNKTEQWIKNKMFHADVLNSLQDGGRGQSSPAYLSQLSTTIINETRGLSPQIRERILKRAAKENLNKEQVRDLVAAYKSAINKDATSRESILLSEIEKLKTKKKSIEVKIRKKEEELSQITGKKAK